MNQIAQPLRFEEPRTSDPAPRPSIISWNLTRLCNEHCRHCYLNAGPYADRSDELSTVECLEVLAQLRSLAPGALLIFTGGEPLLRKDIYELTRAGHEAGFTVVVGTNGIRLTAERLAQLREAGVQGVALSLDSLRPEVHDSFRGRPGAWQATVASIQNLSEEGFPFVLQTTVSRANLAELADLVAFAADSGARTYNLYFLVPTGRGQTFTSDITPAEYESLLRDIHAWQKQYAGRLLLSAKCAPHYQRVLWEENPESPYLRAFDQGAGGCPAGMHYLGIRPNGDVTPCPYLPLYGGNLRGQSLADIWYDSDLFRQIRQRQAMADRCGACEFRLLCGGCRARAYGVRGDVMAEDPWCEYTPGAHGGRPIAANGSITYGIEADAELVWTPEALRLLEVIPAFVRGRVRRGVESYCRQQNEQVVTVEIMQQARQGRGPFGLKKPWSR
ncbi:MAG: radical SAM protein [Caldilineae bacterium]|nr:MAG: radical SAM protein [Caldilineae bacterium]